MPTPPPSDSAGAASPHADWVDPEATPPGGGEFGSAGPPLPPLRIAVADDDAAVREFVRLWLAQMGHEAKAVADGRALVELCRADPPDLVVSDVEMPALDGLAAAAVLRAELGVPVVLMSGGWTPEKQARADALGVRRLEKPFRPLSLVAAIRDAMGR